MSARVKGIQFLAEQGRVRDRPFCDGGMQPLDLDFDVLERFAQRVVVANERPPTSSKMWSISLRIAENKPLPESKGDAWLSRR